MTLDEQYQKIIDDQRTHLLKIQDDFNAACDNSKAQAQKRLGEVAPENKEAREQILKDQKQELETALKTLKQLVDHSTRETMKKLEDIVRQKEAQLLGDLEKQLAAL